MVNFRTYQSVHNTEVSLFQGCPLIVVPLYNGFECCLNSVIILITELQYTQSSQLTGPMNYDFYTRNRMKRKSYSFLCTYFSFALLCR